MDGRYEYTYRLRSDNGNDCLGVHVKQIDAVKLIMLFKNKLALIITICWLIAITRGRRKPYLWPWDIFQKNMNKYDKSVESKAKMTTDEWIKKLNFPCEIHEVITDDGYVLALHRIPKPGHQPVLLVHGLLTSSLSFVMMGADNSLAFQFMSSDFDVWLANTRGSTYSRNHTSLSMDNPLYWKFSFHEIGLYDIPAMVDHIRNVTAFHQIIYVGHSQGATALFVLCAMRPEYNDRILLMQALAPIVFLRNATTVSADALKAIKRFIKDRTKSKSFEIFRQGDLLRECSIKSTKNADCLLLMEGILGRGRYNQSLDPIVLGTALAGGSIQEIEHFLQIHKSGDFVAFDYGLEGNRQKYSQAEPDGYNLSKITMPIIMHYGGTDSIATPDAVHNLHKAFSGTLGVYAVGAAKFNHYDFIWSPSLRSLVNENVIKSCDEFLKGVLKYRIE